MTLKFKIFRNTDFDEQYKFFQESGYYSELKERAELSKKLNIDAVARKPDKLFNAGHFYRELSTEDYESIRLFHNTYSFENTPMEVLKELELAKSLNLFRSFNSITRQTPFEHGFLFGYVDDKKYLIAHWGEKLIQVAAWRLHREKMQKLELKQEKFFRFGALAIIIFFSCVPIMILNAEWHKQSPSFAIFLIWLFSMFVLLSVYCYKQAGHYKAMRKIEEGLPEELY